MRRALTALILAAAALTAAACAPRGSIYADRTGAENHQVKVLAGDRLVIDGQTLTLADAETPQPAPQAGCRAEAIAAAKASETVRSLLTEARDVQVEGGKTGEEKLVHVDGLDLGLTLISQGLAVPRQDAAAMDWCQRGAALQQVALQDAP